MSSNDSNQGLRTLFNPDPDERPEVDIVFVHGLRGHRLDTWSKGSCCWIETLLPKDLPRARVMTFGYDSSVAHIREPSSQNFIFGQAENLLNALKNERRTDDASKRPVIFVGHSLGGLVIKQALIRSKEYLQNGQDARLGAIGQQTLGVVFMATPHHGSDAARLADVVCTAAKATWIGPTPHILDTLKSDSDVLESQHQSFVSIRQDMQLVCIYEALETEGQMIVPQRSAVMDGFYVRVNSIKANHIEVCKFDSQEDDGYKKVIGYIRDILESGLPPTSLPIEVGLPDVAAKRVRNLESTIQNSTISSHSGLLVTPKPVINTDLGPSPASTGQQTPGKTVQSRNSSDPDSFQSIPQQEALTNYSLTGDTTIEQALLDSILDPAITLTQLSSGANGSAKDKDGKTALHYTAASPLDAAVQSMRTLLEEGVDPNMKDNDGKTALHYAAASSSSSAVLLVQTLLTSGADVNVKDNNSSTPLHQAAASTSESAEDVIQVLTNYKADVDPKDKEGKTPLHHASIIPAQRTFEKLCQFKANTSAIDEYGNTPLDYAYESLFEIFSTRIKDGLVDILRQSELQWSTFRLSPSDTRSPFTPNLKIGFRETNVPNDFSDTEARIKSLAKGTPLERLSITAETVKPMLYASGLPTIGSGIFPQGSIGVLDNICGTHGGLHCGLSRGDCGDGFSCHLAMTCHHVMFEDGWIWKGPVEIREEPFSSPACSLPSPPTGLLGARQLPDCPEGEYLDWTIIPVPKATDGTQFCNQFGQSYTALQRNTIRSSSMPGPRRKVLKIGAVTGRTSGRIVAEQFSWQEMEDTCGVRAPSKSDESPLPFEPWAWAVESEEPFARPGDSGSWILNDRYEVIGMLWGGDPRRNIGYFTSMDWINRSILECSKGYS